MAEKRGGMAPLPPGLIRPTTPTQSDESPVEDQVEQLGGADETSAAEQGGKPKSTRAGNNKKKSEPKEKVPTTGRKLYLPDSLYDRLEIYALAKKTTASAVAARILNSNLPKNPQIVLGD